MAIASAQQDCTPSPFSAGSFVAVNKLPGRLQIDRRSRRVESFTERAAILHGHALRGGRVAAMCTQFGRGRRHSLGQQLAE